MAAKKSKRSKKKPARQKSKAAVRKSTRKTAQKKSGGGLFTSAFTRKFREFLTGPDPARPSRRIPIWPPAGQLTGESLQQTASVVSMLGTAFANDTPPPPGLAGTFLGGATKVAIDYGWPTNPVYAGKWPGHVTAVHLAEIRHIADMLIVALGGGAGGGSKIPPAH